LQRETHAALRIPAVRDKLAALGVEPMLTAPGEFSVLIENEIALNMVLAKTAGIQAQ
jgi:hypothetical protein